MRVAVSGAHGFIGRRVVVALRSAGHEVLEITRATELTAAQDAIRSSGAFVHLAGVNRPKHAEEFATGNIVLTRAFADALDFERLPTVVFSSSTQAEVDNPYGRSKREAERILERVAQRGASVVIFRLPNVFGPGGRAEYNSAAATFAYNAARNLPIVVNDPERELTLVYVHDVARAMVDAVEHPPASRACERRSVGPTNRIMVGELADRFREYAAARSTRRTPRVSTEFDRQLYATFVSSLPMDALPYALTQRSDARGALAEFLRSDTDGQIFVSRTRPGVTRGNHFHLTKVEKFLVLEGEASVRFRKVGTTGPVVEHRVSGRDFIVIDIPPDHTHSIENVGVSDLIVLFWASELFDPQASDTHPLDVF
jgi:UDP-2-acetamido-2,6-beta-L-arabino-hexul-4-ose reductase